MESSNSETDNVNNELDFISLDSLFSQINGDEDENENKQTLGSLIKDYTKNKLINYTNLTMNQTHTDASLSNIINKQVKKYKYKQSNSTEIRDIKKISIPKLNFTTIFEEQENKKKNFQKYYLRDLNNIDIQKQYKIF